MCPACLSTVAVIAGCTSGAAVLGFSATKTRWWRGFLKRIADYRERFR
jgi:hypothetical protein